MIATGFGLTDIGLKRKQNQDNFAIDDDLQVYVVADGMGGHHGGEVASSISVTTIMNYFKEVQKPKTIQEAKKIVTHAIDLANQAIQNKGKEDIALKDMGTTTSLAYFFQDETNAHYAIIGQIGDSRVYYIHKNKIWQLTQDHSLVAERLRSGLITREEMEKAGNKNVLTRALGYDNDKKCDTYFIKTNLNDKFLICSDGLHGLVKDHEILEIITKNINQNNEPKVILEELIQTANKNGGQDNITAVLIDIKE
jgi:protein phosphatase